MENDKIDKFVTYPLALKLEQLGFNEECECFWDDENTIDTFIFLDDGKNKNSTKEHPRIISAPLWQEAFDWFRDKYNLDSYVSKITYREWKLEINYILQNDSEEEWNKSKRFIDFKDNQKDARITCLEKLIELFASMRLGRVTQ